MTRKALGRGLSALLSADQEATPVGENFEIELRLIDPSPLQPRTVFDQKGLDDLAESIREHGLVQPVLVRRSGGRYELIVGERRWRAARQAGLEKIPALLRDVPNEEVLELALIENIQRENLNPIEEATAYKNLIEQVGLTQESVAKRVGRDRSYITNYLRLLRLPDDLKLLVQDGKLSTGHARALLGTSEAALQRRLARRIIEKALNVRQVESLIREHGKSDKEGTKARSQTRPADPNIKAAEARLRRKLATHVRIVESATGAGGRIEIEYYSPQELSRFYDRLMGEPTTTV